MKKNERSAVFCSLNSAQPCGGGSRSRAPIVFSDSNGLAVTSPAAAWPFSPATLRPLSPMFCVSVIFLRQFLGVSFSSSFQFYFATECWNQIAPSRRVPARSLQFLRASHSPIDSLQSARRHRTVFCRSHSTRVSRRQLCATAAVFKFIFIFSFLRCITRFRKSPSSYCPSHSCV